MANDKFHYLLSALLIRHEGVRLKPYKDSVGKTTIAIGRNLDDVGISREEAVIMLDNDIRTATEEVKQAFPWYKDLNNARQTVIISMAFNLGLPRLLKFKKMISAMYEEDYETASEEMMDSKWAGQVGYRAVDLSEMMRVGSYIE